jgi:hypothetical protein
MRPEVSKPPESRALCISLHDVAPATLPECRRALQLLDARLLGPVALLVVPDYHGLGRVDRDRPFRAFIDARLERGDEVVLHGWRHLDEGPPCRRLGEWIERRVRTDSEGEFACMEEEQATLRLLRGLAVLRSAGWQPHGFVAPAWLFSEGTYAALESLGFAYTCTRDTLLPLHGEPSMAAPSLVCSARSRWRRIASSAWNRARRARLVHARVLRAALHPADARHADLLRLWGDLLDGVSEGRRVLTEGALLARLSA